jgi:hypothetical protein
LTFLASILVIPCGACSMIRIDYHTTWKSKVRFIVRGSQAYR